MKPYHPMQRLTAAFLFLSFCLQSCIPSLKLGYVPVTKEHIHAQEALPRLAEQAHLVPTDSLNPNFLKV